MHVTETSLPGVILIESQRFGDDRGFFLESFNEKRYRDLAGITVNFVQDNWSHSEYGVLRGLHYQWQHTQGKLVWTSRGDIFDVVVDIRYGSPHFGQFFCVLLKASEGKQLYIPPGFAHGFCTLSETVDVHYKCTDYYDPHAEISLLWNDPDLAIPWPITQPRISEKDQRGIRLCDISIDRLPRYQEHV